MRWSRRLSIWAPWNGFSALNDHAVVRAFQGNTHRGEFVYHDIKTVRFFDFQLLRIPDHGCTVRCGGKNRDDRDFIDQVGISSPSMTVPERDGV